MKRAFLRRSAGAAALLSLVAASSLHAQSHWMASLAGNGFAAYTRQSSLRGSDETAVWGWVHAGLGRMSPNGSVTADAMLTLDPLVQGECGYQRLMAGWATCAGAPLEDRTHPQPFVMRLGVRGERSLGPLLFSLDGALVGDPPLGVPSYMHRASAAADPVMPMNMAETTPAHAVGGVATVGVALGPVGVEASRFNGGGGATDRWDLALGGLHSWAARLTWHPLSALGLYGGLGDLEASAGHHEGMGAMRVESVGAEWLSTMGGRGEIAMTLAGVQRTHGEHNERAGLFEALATLGRHTLFGRAERTDRSLVGMDVIIRPDGSHEHLMTYLPYDVNELSVGYSIRTLDRWGAGLSVGGRYGFAHVSRLLVHGYGGQSAHTLSFFLNLGSGRSGGGSHPMD